MNRDPLDLQADACRRTFLRASAAGLGAFALSALEAESRAADPAGAAPPAAEGPLPPHFAPKCKRVIFLYMAGGPSHLETFDPKPVLAKNHGKPMPESFTKGQQLAQLQGQKLLCFGPQWNFKKYGKSGLEISELFPHLGKMADELCVLRSMHTEQINHDPAHAFMNSGALVAGRPSMGSWLLYGLGAETKNLPGYVVLTSAGKGGQMQPIAARQWSSGFLPSKYQGVKLNSLGDPVHHIRTPDGLTTADQRATIDALSALNRRRYELQRDPEILTRIAQYELAFRMQASVPELVDMAKEPKSVLDLYGATPGDGSFASNCLLARRLVERGVRFVQLYHRDWDHHGNIKKDVQLKAEEVDRPFAGLLADLKSRDMLKDTLVVWGGEFGRTPMSQGGSGRDHHIKAMSMVLAGGGVKGGLAYGATDDFGYAAQVDPVSV
ncbi:MAG TPA: DUF1501 domain-containing protein, partial [Planctomycetia bacterium]|nr:DUF1501 domain-containing protein [Planctomycetia bacterium]